MKYTTSKKADKKIEQDMKIIREEIRKKIPGTLSIILTGGFSRGEGAVKMKNEKIFLYNDYDILVVARNPSKKQKIDKIAGEISQKLGYGKITNIFYPFKKENQSFENNFYVDLKITTRQNLKKLISRIRHYELKNNSMLLYGKDTRNLIPDYKLDEIPLSEGAKLLLDRMSQMIEYYSQKKLHDNEFLTYVIQQAYAAMCTSLLILSGKYQIGYKKSMQIFKKTYKKDFPELYKKIPNLNKKIEEFILWKINPEKLPFKNIEKEWFIAKKNILEVSKYFFSKFLKKEIKNEDELATAIKKMGKEFYTPYLMSRIKNEIKNKKLSKILAPLIYIILPSELRRRYNQRLKNLGAGKTSQKFPDLFIFSSLIYIASSINRKGVDEKFLMKGKSLLNKVYPCKGKDWEEISIDYANAYIAFFMQKL